MQTRASRFRDYLIIVRFFVQQTCCPLLVGSCMGMILGTYQEREAAVRAFLESVKSDLKVIIAPITDALGQAAYESRCDLYTKKSNRIRNHELIPKNAAWKR